MIRWSVLFLTMVFLSASLYAEVIPVRLPPDSLPQGSDKPVSHAQVPASELDDVYVVGQAKSFWYETIIGVVVLFSVAYLLYNQARK